MGMAAQGLRGRSSKTIWTKSQKAPLARLPMSCTAIGRPRASHIVRNSVLIQQTTLTARPNVTHFTGGSARLRATARVKAASPPAIKPRTKGSKSRNSSGFTVAWAGRKLG